MIIHVNLKINTSYARRKVNISDYMRKHYIYMVKTTGRNEKYRKKKLEVKDTSKKKGI